MNTYTNGPIKLIRDNFQNYKRYNIPKAQLVIADIPYNTGSNAYASNPKWYKDGDNKKGESDLARKQFFNSDDNFRIAEFMHFCSKMLKPEPKETGKAPAMIVFCAFDQFEMVKDYGRRYGFKNSYPIFFIKDYSPQVLKANMKIVGATEMAVVLYRDKLPKFNNGVKKDEDGKNIVGTGKMIFNWFYWKRDLKHIPKIHPTQKPIENLKELIEIFTDPGDVITDPVAGSSSTLRAVMELNHQHHEKEERQAYGFEIDRKFYQDGIDKMLNVNQFQLKLF